MRSVQRVNMESRNLVSHWFQNYGKLTVQGLELSKFRESLNLRSAVPRTIVLIICLEEPGVPIPLPT
jgi:hypothetical protein